MEFSAAVTAASSAAVAASPVLKRRKLSPLPLPLSPDKPSPAKSTTPVDPPPDPLNRRSGSDLSVPSKTVAESDLAETDDSESALARRTGGGAPMKPASVTLKIKIRFFDGTRTYVVKPWSAAVDAESAPKVRKHYVSRIHEVDDAKCLSGNVEENVAGGLATISGNCSNSIIRSGEDDGGSNRRAIRLCKKPSNYSGNGNGGVSIRDRVKRALRLFQSICRTLLQGEEAKSRKQAGGNRIDLMAASILKEKKEWLNKGKPILGHVPGVEVGDEFHFRVELAMVGLHRVYQGGIDFMRKNDKVVATSIVASGGYPDDLDCSDVLIYTGSGGNPALNMKLGDQKLERGNLALKNSIDARTPVRVIYGVKDPKGKDHVGKTKLVSTYTYDGLYAVESYRTEMGPDRFLVFKFRLRRMAGQPERALKEVRRSMKSNVREGLCIKDISDGLERIPICSVNTVDDDRPMHFEYRTKNIYPSWYVNAPPRGCDCVGGCVNPMKCACAAKNGGELPFNYNGAIVRAKPLVFECGPSCRCPPSCYNRVSQHGIKIPLEIFKTKLSGWGVRSLRSIPSGSFICEYTGELLKDSEAEQRNNDEYLFDIGRNYEDNTLWEGLPSLIPGLLSAPSTENLVDVGFTIDAAKYGNVGRFINHSCSPNLYAQNVLYDHCDKRMPHIMLFAADNIPPLRELTYHYNYTIDAVHDSEGNIKRKNCYCGSPSCTGRLY